LTLLLAPSARSGAGRSYLDNGVVSVGVDIGNGEITYLGPAGGDSPNLLVDAQPQERSGWGPEDWHPHPSAGATMLAFANDGRTIYAEVVPNLELGGVCECVFESWITLDGAAVRVRYRMTNFRADATRYPAQWQGLPGLFSTGPYRHLWTYDGAAPFTRAPLHEITDHAGVFFHPPEPSWLAGEHWAALTDDAGFGLGLFAPDSVRMVGVPGVAQDAGWINGMVVTAGLGQIDANQVWGFRYALVVGTLAQIRAYAYAHRPDPRPR
jgi:hypothetical protein